MQLRPKDLSKRRLVSYLPGQNDAAWQEAGKGIPPSLGFSANNVQEYVCGPLFDRNCQQVEKGVVWVGGKASYLQKPDPSANVGIGKQESSSASKLPLQVRVTDVRQPGEEQNKASGSSPPRPNLSRAASSSSLERTLRRPDSAPGGGGRAPHGQHAAGTAAPQDSFAQGSTARQVPSYLDPEIGGGLTPPRWHDEPEPAHGRRPPPRASSSGAASRRIPTHGSSNRPGSSHGKPSPLETLSAGGRPPPLPIRRTPEEKMLAGHKVGPGSRGGGVSTAVHLAAAPTKGAGYMNSFASVSGSRWSRRYTPGSRIHEMRQHPSSSPTSIQAPTTLHAAATR